MSPGDSSPPTWLVEMLTSWINCSAACPKGFKYWESKWVGTSSPPQGEPVDHGRHTGQQVLGKMLGPTFTSTTKSNLLNTLLRLGHPEQATESRVGIAIPRAMLSGCCFHLGSCLGTAGLRDRLSMSLKLGGQGFSWLNLHLLWNRRYFQTIFHPDRSHMQGD